MASVLNKLIKYSGINSCADSDYKYFKQFNRDQIICIPHQKPDMEQLIRVWADACIFDHSLVKTPVGESLEGQTMTGNKLFVSGVIKIKYQYVANEIEQSVHTAEGCIPFCEYVVLPKNFSESQTFSPYLAIEDIFSEQLDLRCVNNNLTLLLIVHLC